jgi:hypothetical protein
MTTHEQRITSLEQFQRETIAAVQESNMHITAQMGIVSEQEKDIKRTLAVVEEHTAQLMLHTATLMQHNETLIEHSVAIQELLSRLPAKE